MKRGFKSECESIATAVRAEMGLAPHAPLDSRDLAEHIGIPLHPLSSLDGKGVTAAIGHVRANSAVLSAMTIFPEWPLPRRLVIFNDGNSQARQNSDLAHELAHGLLMHEPRYAIVSGCRDYAKADEDEAAWLAGCLLVPREAALVVAMAGTPMGIAAVEYGVSTQMMTYRVNSTGARRQAEASRRRARGLSGRETRSRERAGDMPLRSRQDGLIGCRLAIRIASSWDVRDRSDMSAKLGAASPRWVVRVKGEGLDAEVMCDEAGWMPEPGVLLRAASH